MPEQETKVYAVAIKNAELGEFDVLSAHATAGGAARKAMVWLGAEAEGWIAFARSKGPDWTSLAARPTIPVVEGALEKARAAAESWDGAASLTLSICLESEVELKPLKVKA